jgi:hypothetical protein
VKRALAALLLFAGLSSTACNPFKGDCIDGLEGQIRCRSDAATPSATEVCLDGDWELLQACDAAGGYACTSCVATDGTGPHACAPCPAGGTAVAQCALASPVLTCP